MKNDFPLLKNNPNIVYLDSAATSQKPRSVLDAINEFYTTSNANAHRGIYSISIKASLAMDEARKTIAQFFNTTDRHIVFTKNTTESLNLLSRSIPILKDQNIIITEIEHHSNFVPWQELAKRSGAHLKIASYDKETFSLESISELVDQKTRIVSFTAMSNVSGQKFPVKNIIKAIRAKNKDAIIIVDACQWAVHEPIDVNELDADYLACSAHKLYGPLGVGILYARDLEELPPFLYGGDMIESVSKESTTYAKGPTKFEAGTMDVAGIVGAAKAIEYLQDHRHDAMRIEKELTDLALKELKKIKGINIIGHQGEPAGSIISFFHESVPALDIAQFCAADNVCVRVGQHCAEPFLKALGVHATIRISIGLYNSEGDILQAIQSISSAIEKIMRKRT
ncbi:MAG: aminotransferase class V-fold PLP-dependent enzyme [Nanoarchaeota archaeon]|nr:aminotransferase class V-fold PLP-dependent enzyme [Nanoarchaeota archaeon]